MYVDFFLLNESCFYIVVMSDIFDSKITTMIMSESVAMQKCFPFMSWGFALENDHTVVSMWEPGVIEQIIHNSKCTFHEVNLLSNNDC